MPTECERSVNAENTEQTALTATRTHSDLNMEIGKDKEKDAYNDEMSTSQTSNTSSTSNGHNGSAGSAGSVGCSKKTSITSPDPTAYVAKARVTRPTPPPPSYNPMQFVQIKPCNLYQTAQEQLKKAEEVKKIKEIKKEEPEDWQNNLDNWKSSRRKRVEHIIDRVVEVKKLELEEHDRSRKKSKTFSEMIEERGERNGRQRVKLASLTVYNEEETNDFSDLGIGNSSASGKSSVSEDYDNNSVMSDNVAELDKTIFENNHKPNSTTREYISSPGYDTSSSTAPASSPDPCEYTYEGAIQDYKQRVSRATSGITGNANLINSHNLTSPLSKESTPERVNSAPVPETYPTRRGNKIEDRLIGFEVNSPSDSQEGAEKVKVDVPKIDISKRKEIFENQQTNTNNEPKPLGSVGGVPKVTLRDRFTPADAANTATSGYSEAQEAVKKEVKRLSGDITSIRDRLQSLEQQQNTSSAANGPKIVDIPVPPLKERLSSLQNAVTKEDIKKPPVVLIDARQLEIMKTEEESAKQRMKNYEGDRNTNTDVDTIDNSKQSAIEEAIIVMETEVKILTTTDNPTEADPDDSGIHTSDDIETEERIAEQILQREQEQQLNAAIAALALEEQQLEAAANVVNQIEAEFAELSSQNAANVPITTIVSSTNEQPCEMEFSVSSTNNQIASPSNSSTSALNIDSSYSNGSGIGNSNRNVQCVSHNIVDDSTQVLGNTTTIDDVNRLAPAPNLQRKPSNEMVHARNLLRLFKETFQDDIQIDEIDELETVKTTIQDTTQNPYSTNLKANVSIESPVSTKPPQSPSSVVNAPVMTQTFQSSVTQNTTVPSSSTQVDIKPAHASNSNPKSTEATSMIPRPLNPLGKPPMSPKTVRSPTKVIPQSPLCSPTPNRKQDNQFSISGRVEIFNSKNMSNVPKPTTPILQSHKSHLPHFTTASSATTTPTNKTEVNTTTSAIHDQTETLSSENASNNIELQTKSLQQKVPLSTAVCAVTEPLTISNQTTSDTQSMSTKLVNEPQEIQSVLNTVDAVAMTQKQQHNEVVICAPPVTILNPDELPKPNTVKALSSCFSQDVSKATPPMPPPKPLPRSRIAQTPPQSPTPAKRNLIYDPKPQHLPVSDATKKLSLISNTSTASDASQGSPDVFQTTAVIHSQPTNFKNLTEIPKLTKLQISKSPVDSSDPLSPNDSLSPVISIPSPIPPLVVCSPNESSLFKLASSAPHSPVAPHSPNQPTDADIALCTSFLSSAAANVSKPIAQVPPHQKSVEEVPCTKIDVRKLPVHDQVPHTTYFEISPAEVKRCDNLNSATPTKTKPSSKPNSPIMAARAAHSKALIETCERIIAEERLASSQMKSTLPSSPKATPISQRKSKIPKPIPCCIGSGSISTADIELETKKANQTNTPANNLTSSPKSDEEMLVARMHVVETQIKVTTTTPPTSPPPTTKNSTNNPKKTKNIFDFIKKNFGYHDDTSAQDNPDATQAKSTSPQDSAAVDTVKIDEIFRIENSKFYVPSDETLPPPLPLSPAPVNIEITKKITTDEIVEENTTDQAFSQEINDLLDDELNKLSLENEIVKEGNKSHEK